MKNILGRECVLLLTGDAFSLGKLWKRKQSSRFRSQPIPCRPIDHAEMVMCKGMVAAGVLPGVESYLYDMLNACNVFGSKCGRFTSAFLHHLTQACHECVRMRCSSQRAHSIAIQLYRSRWSRPESASSAHTCCLLVTTG